MFRSDGDLSVEGHFTATGIVCLIYLIRHMNVAAKNSASKEQISIHCISVLLKGYLFAEVMILDVF